MKILSRFFLSTGFAVTLLGVANAQGHHWRGGGWSFFGGLMQLLFLALVVLGIIFLVQVLRSQHLGSPRVFDMPGTKPTAPQAQDAAMQILRERLAKGEIDPEDYEARRKVLTET